MELVRCKMHKTPCILKTGTRPGSSFGRSFYICSASESKCDYVQQSDLPQEVCPEHGATVEMQMYHYSHSSGQHRVYYRCVKGKEKQVKWCKYKIFERAPQEKSSSTENRQAEVVKPPGDHDKTDLKFDERTKDAKPAAAAASTSHKTTENLFASPVNNKPFLPDTKVFDKPLNDSFLSYRDSSSKPPRDKPTDNHHKSSTTNSATTQAIAKPTSKEDSKDGETNKLVEQMLNLSIADLRAKHDSLEKTLQAKKHLLASVTCSKLPDGGAKLKAVIDGLAHELHCCKLSIEKVGRQESRESQIKDKQVPSHGVVTQPQKPLDVTSQPVKREKDEEDPTRRNIAGQLLANNMRQTKITDHTRPMSAHVFQQMYAGNPQAMTLYGGRMTKARLNEVGIVTADALESLHKQLETCPGAEDEVEDPAHLTVTLYPHQRQALAWMLWREKQLPSGGILADDMGLGKTLTMISLVMKTKSRAKSSKDDDDDDDFVSKQKRAQKLVTSRATLVVCPASLIHQWEKEIARKVKGHRLKVLVYHGPNRERSLERLADNDIVLTTYNLVSREVPITDEEKKDKALHERPATDQDFDEQTVMQQPNLLRIAWRRIILDEAHNIKNPKSLTALCVCRLRATSRWAITGTPVQNDLMDVYSLLRYLRCSPFDELKLWKRQVDNKTSKGYQRLNTLIKTLLLRRTKDQKTKSGDKLVNLPTKNVKTISLDLRSDERRIYDQIFKKSRSTLQQYIQRHENGSSSFGGSSRSTTSAPPGATSMAGAVNPWAKSDTHPACNGAVVPGSSAPRTTNTVPGTGQILLHILRLRQCCGHLHLLKDAADLDDLEGNNEGIDLDIVQQLRSLGLQDEQIEDVCPDGLSSTSNGATSDSVTGEPKSNPDANSTPLSKLTNVSTLSSKISELLGCLKKYKAEATQEQPLKCVVVSQWTKMLDIIDHHLQRTGFSSSMIKGDVPPKERSARVDSFNMDPKGPEVLLVSLRAGGVGLNLVGGNYLFMMDLHWNPALEEQACDRIYRVGQKRNVVIHKFICKSTIEEKIVQLQAKKQGLARDVLAGDAAAKTKLSLNDLKTLFNLDIPDNLPHRTW